MTSLPDTLRLGAAHLTVTDLERSVAYYQDVLGLQQHRRQDGEAVMGAGGEDLVVLVVDPQARPAGRHAGLFHFALLFDSREELAHAVLRLAAARTALTGASDHGVSEAIYLRDPDHNGIELYADRPREAWPEPDPALGGRIGMYTIALDVDDLLATVAGEDPRPRAGGGLRMGHLHLHVGDLARALEFYRDVLGFDLMVEIPANAEFLAAGGYHHHLGVNVWAGQGIPAMPPDAVGLRHWTIVLDGAEQVDEVRRRLEAAGSATSDEQNGFLARDPWDVGLVVRTG